MREGSPCGPCVCSYSALMPASRITLPRRSMSERSSLVMSSGVVVYISTACAATLEAVVGFVAHREIIHPPEEAVVRVDLARSRGSREIGLRGKLFALPLAFVQNELAELHHVA